MCNHTTLYHDNSVGYVIHCTDCKTFQLGFGNLSINFRPDAFEDFLCMIRAAAAREHAVFDPTHKNIMLATPCEGVNFLLSSGELDQLYNMLDIAETEWRSQVFINLFNK